MPLIPREYQEKGILFLRSHHRAMLCDAPGIGKTLQAALAATKPVLIAAPTYLVEQWASFLEEQFSSDKVALAIGTSIERYQVLTKSADWYIVNIEMLRSYRLPKVETFIIDESHHVRGRNSQQSRGAYNYALHTRNVFLLTATPICNQLDDLYMQLSIIDPRRFHSYGRFEKDYCKVLSTSWGNKVVGAKNPKEVRALLDNYGLSRGYKDVGLELPDLIEHRITVTPSNEFKKAYRQLKDHFRLGDLLIESVPEKLQTLRQMTCCKEKTDALEWLVKDQAVGAGIVVYCWYRFTAEHLGKILKVPVITGDTPAGERKKIAHKAKIVVATLASMSEGVDLSSHKMIVFFEEDYTPGIMYQSMSRVRRHSNNNDPVRLYTILLKDTVDEVVHKAVKERIADARAILRRALV